MDTIQCNVEYIAKSIKTRVSQEGLQRLAGATALAVLIEVESLDVLCKLLRTSESSGLKTSASGGLPAGWLETPSVFDHPIVRAVLNARELAEMLSWACVLKVEEDANVSAL